MTKSLHQKQALECQVCFVKNMKAFRYNQLIQCYVCHKTSHRYCYQPICMETEFMCDQCLYNSKTPQQCFICGNHGLLKKVQNKFAHPLCMLFSPYFLVNSYQNLSFIQIQYSKHEEDYSMNKCQICHKGNNLLKCYAQCQNYAHMYCLWKAYEPTSNQGWIQTTVFQQSYSFQDFYLNSLKRYLKLKQSVALQFVNKFVSKTSRIKVQTPVYEVSCQGHLSTIFHCCTNLKYLKQQNLKWIYCEQCCRWYHEKCVKGKKKINENQDFVCKGCVQFQKLIIKQNLQDIDLKELPRLNICELIYIQVVFQSKNYNLSINQKQLLFKLPIYPSKKYAQTIIKQKISEKMVSQISFSCLKKKLQYQGQEFMGCFKSKQVQRMLQLVQFVISKQLVETQQEDEGSIIQDIAIDTPLLSLAKTILYLLKAYNQKYINGKSSMLLKIISKLDQYLNSQGEEHQINLSTSYQEQSFQKSKHEFGQNGTKVKGIVKRLLQQLKQNPTYLLEIRKIVKNSQNLIKQNENKSSTSNKKSILQGFLLFDNVTDINDYIKIRYLLWNYYDKYCQPINSQTQSRQQIKLKAEASRELRIIFQIYQKSSSAIKIHFKHQIRTLDLKQCEFNPTQQQTDFPNIELLSLNKKLTSAIFDFSQFKDLNSFKKCFKISENVREQDLLKVLKQKKLVFELKNIEFTRQNYQLIRKKLESFCLPQNENQEMKDYKQQLFLEWIQIYQILQSFADLCQKYKKRLLQNYGIQELKSKQAIEVLSQQEAVNEDLLGTILKFFISLRVKRVKYSRYHEKLLKTVIKMFQNIIPVLKQYKQLWLNFQQTYDAVKELVFKICSKSSQTQNISMFLDIFKKDQIQLQKLSFTEVKFESPRLVNSLAIRLQHAQIAYKELGLNFRVNKIKTIQKWICIFQSAIQKIHPYYILSQDYIDQVKNHKNRISIYQLQTILKLMRQLQFPSCQFKSKLQIIYTQILDIKSKFNNYFNACNWEFTLQKDNNYNSFSIREKDKHLEQNFSKFYHKERKIDMKKMREIVEKAKFNPIVSFQLEIVEIQAVMGNFMRIKQHAEELMKINNFAKNNFQKFKHLAVQLIKNPFLFEKVGDFQIQLTRQWILSQNQKKKNNNYQEVQHKVRNVQEEYFSLVNALECSSNSNNEMRQIYKHQILKTLTQLDKQWKKWPKIHRNHLIVEYKERILTYMKNFAQIYEKFNLLLKKYKNQASSNQDSVQAKFTQEELAELEYLFYQYQCQKVKDSQIQDIKMSVMIYKNCLSVKLIDYHILKCTLKRIQALPSSFFNNLILSRRKQIQKQLTRIQQSNYRSDGTSEYLENVYEKQLTR